MPWCPKCSSEYREGFRICADCGCDLISDEAYAKLEEERKDAEKRRLTEEMRIQYEALSGQGESDMEVSGSVEEASSAEAADLVQTLSKNAESASAAQALLSKKAASGSMLYQDSAERASENRSSAWILLILGSLGIVVVGLGIAGILPLSFGNSYLFYGVMSAVFILFLVSGIISMKNALVFDKKAESENSLRDTILKWCKENLDGAVLDEQIASSEESLEEVSEEILYFRRFEKIRDRLNYQFVNLDQDFLDRFIDDCIYDMVFPQKTENE